MTPIARFSPRSGRDIDEIAERIATDNLDAALRFYLAVRSNAEHIARMPGMGPVWGFPEHSLADIRFWPITGFRNYLLFYRRISAGIEILRVLHGARNIDGTMMPESS